MSTGYVNWGQNDGTVTYYTNYMLIAGGRSTVTLTGQSYGIVTKDASSCRAGQVVKAHAYDRTWSGSGWYTYICARTHRDDVNDRTAEDRLLAETATSGVGSTQSLPSDGDYYPVIAFRTDKEANKSCKIDWWIVTDAD